MPWLWDSRAHLRFTETKPLLPVIKIMEANNIFYTAYSFRSNIFCNLDIPFLLDTAFSSMKSDNNPAYSRCLKLRVKIINYWTTGSNQIKKNIRKLVRLCFLSWERLGYRQLSQHLCFCSITLNILKVKKTNPRRVPQPQVIIREIGLMVWTMPGQKWVSNIPIYNIQLT